jgi:hypothetical protein
MNDFPLNWGGKVNVKTLIEKRNFTSDSLGWSSVLPGKDALVNS